MSKEKKRCAGEKKGKRKQEIGRNEGKRRTSRKNKKRNKETKGVGRIRNGKGRKVEQRVNMERKQEYKRKRK